jgi:hypothetical protein
MQLTDKTKEMERLRQELHIAKIKCASLKASKLEKKLNLLKYDYVLIYIYNNS